MAKKPRQAKTHGERMAEQMVDEDFRADWERLAFARAVAAKVIEYRADHGLSQRQVADQIGVAQPQIARLEVAEHHPSDTMLRRLTALGMEFTISYVAAGREPKLITKKAREREVARIAKGGSVVRYSAA